MYSVFLRRLAPLICLLPTLSGCEDSATVTGSITYENEPIENGYITFLPSDGKGPTAGGKISKGQYQVEDVTPGSKIVKIEAVRVVTFARSSEEMREMAKKARSRGNRTGIIDPADSLPRNARGNNAKVEIQLGDQVLDFDLKEPKRRRR